MQSIINFSITDSGQGYYHTLNALKTLSFNSSAFDSDIDRAATVDMEDDVFWLFNMID